MWIVRVALSRPYTFIVMALVIGIFGTLSAASLSKPQHAWIDTLKNSCQSCHALGSKGVRTFSEQLGEFSNSIDAWMRRIQSGQAMTNMFATLSRLGSNKALALFADWTPASCLSPSRSGAGHRAQSRDYYVGLGQWQTLSSRCSPPSLSDDSSLRWLEIST